MNQYKMNIECWMGKDKGTDLWAVGKAADYCRAQYISILQPFAFNLNTCSSGLPR